MRLITKRFLTDDAGAVTVDWVVLTAVIIGLSLAVIGTISNGAMDEANGLGAHLSANSIASY
jgi:Flp pilus assembly pilin Flp